MLLNMGRLLKQNTLRFHDRLALVNVERNRRYTYRQMDDISNRICNMMKLKFGLKRNDFYVTILANDNMALFYPWMLKSQFGGVWIDVRETLVDKLSHIDFTGPKVIFLEENLLDELYESLKERGLIIISMDRPVKSHHEVHYFWDLLAETSVQSVEIDLPADDTARHICFLRFTSGTSGKSKCAMYSLNNIWLWSWNPVHYVEIMPYELPKVLLFSPIHHAASASAVLPVILKGGCIITLNKAGVDEIGDTIAKEKIDMIYAVPTVLYRIIEKQLHLKYDLSSLKTIRYGAAPISPPKLERLLEIFGQILVQTYGSTECWPSCTILSPKDHQVSNEKEIRRLSSVGRPFPGQEIIVRDDQERPVANGCYGELWIRGVNTICGYYNAPELTKENFSSDGFWKSGDIGYIDDEGYVYIVDRKKDMIISGGYNVYASEVENCLNKHEHVQNSAVFGIPDETWGEAVCAVVVLTKGRDVHPKDLIDHCKKNLTHYKVPKKLFIRDIRYL